MEINKLKIFSLPFIFYLVRENNEESEEKFNLNNIETVSMECRGGLDTGQDSAVCLVLLSELIKDYLFIL